MKRITDAKKLVAYKGYFIRYKYCEGIGFPVEYRYKSCRYIPSTDGNIHLAVYMSDFDEMVGQSKEYVYEKLEHIVLCEYV